MESGHFFFEGVASARIRPPLRVHMEPPRTLSFSGGPGGVVRRLRWHTWSCSGPLAITSSTRSREPSSNSALGARAGGGGGTSDSLGSLGFRGLGFGVALGVFAVDADGGAGEPLSAMLPTRNLMTGRRGPAGVGVGGKGVSTGTEGFSLTIGVVGTRGFV